jgi:ABC-type multidrug transport system fused ATPase/permease subunit
LTNFVGSLIIASGAIYASQQMHLGLLSNVLRWPMELFDITPIGRVLNRFAKDVDVVDNILPQVFRSWIVMFFSVNTGFFESKFCKKKMFSCSLAKLLDLQIQNCFTVCYMLFSNVLSLCLRIYVVGVSVLGR